jgi:hypothetical protein
MILIGRYYKWQDHRLNEWFDDQEHLQYTLGLVPNAGMADDPKLN